MYNRYIPNGTTYTRVTVEDVPPPPRQPSGAGGQAQERPLGGENRQTNQPFGGAQQQNSFSGGSQQQNPFFGGGQAQNSFFGGGGQTQNPFAGLGKMLPPFLFGKGKEEGGGGLSGLLKTLKLDSLDSGDILLLLIVLFLLLEGDNLELVIALGLVLIMGLTDDKEKQEGD